MALAEPLIDRGQLERAAILYLPLVAALLARLLQGSRARQSAACLLSLLWALPALLVVQRLNLVAEWWSFPWAQDSFRGMPLELFLGWIVLWGLVPQLAFPRLNIFASATIMVALDCMGMPLCRTTVALGSMWLEGEAVAVVLVLLPSLYLARWTLDNRHLKLRAAMQAVLASMLFLFLVPEICFALTRGQEWAPMLALPGWAKQLALQALLLLALPGLSAVAEFAARGGGTPIPYDPPTRLVTSGIYRYVANPMQLSCALAMLGWAALLRNGWLATGALIGVAYSAGIARWDEREDLSARFGEAWRDYRSVVRDWVPGWRPYHAGPLATLYVSRTCAQCSQVRRWIAERRPLGLDLRDAEVLPAESILRMRYEPGDGSVSVEGVRAMARALEHLNLGWALVGAAIRLPAVWQALQLLMDASGFGPRLLQAREAGPAGQPFGKFESPKESHVTGAVRGRVL